MMRRLAPMASVLSRRPWLVLAVGATLLVAGSSVSERSHRRRLLRRGCLEELRGTWVMSGGGNVFMRYGVRAARPGQLPVVLVHGWGISSAYFIPLAERLAVDFEVYVPDLPGHGRSSRGARALDVPGQAMALLDWMEAAGIERAILVGHSLGCQLVTAVAQHSPDRVARLVLIGPTVDPKARHLPSQLARLVLSGIFEHPSLLRYMLRDYVRMNRWLVPELRGMMADTIETRLADLQQPVMVVRGGRDLLAPPRWLRQVARLTKAKQTVEIPGWGHAVHYSAADRLVTALHPFLAEELDTRCGSAGRPRLGD